VATTVINLGRTSSTKTKGEGDAQRDSVRSRHHRGRNHRWDLLDDSCPGDRLRCILSKREAGDRGRTYIDSLRCPQHPPRIGFTSTVSVDIPEPVAKALDLKAGDKLDISLNDHQMILEKVEKAKKS
jgi:hypothetical protein